MLVGFGALGKGRAPPNRVSVMPILTYLILSRGDFDEAKCKLTM